MAYMVSTSLNIHWVKRIEARSNTEGTLTLSFRGDPDANTDQFNIAEVTAFMDDHELVQILIAAINKVNEDRELFPIDPAFTPYRAWKGEDDEPAF